MHTITKQKKIVQPLSLQRLFYPLIIYLMLCLFLLNNASARESVCAQVKIEIKQEASLERQAFDAVIKIHNGLETASLDDIEISVQFTDDQNNPIIASSDPNNTEAKFFIKVDSMSGVTDVNGSGEVLPSSSAEVHWLIIPAPGSGGNIPSGKAYNVGATLKYKLGETAEEVTVIPDVIYVKPLPRITLDYFLTAQVVADDPFTQTIEPSEPFTLGVRVNNHGQAAAHHFQIDSAQPKIIENDQGLLINFNLVGSTVDDMPVEPDLLLNFGDIPGNSSRIGRWWMLTTLAGQFVEFTATWSHADELGGQLTSIMEAVNTHFLVHDVQVDLPGRDNVLDFLALDGAQLRVYESENIDTLVSSLGSQSTLSFAHSLNNQDYYELTMPVSGSFIHSKKEISASLANTKAIKQVIRSDNKVLKEANAWISKEGNGADGWTYYINLFDFNTPGTYSLIFGEKINTNQAPVIEFVAHQTAQTEQDFNLIITASDPDNTIPVMTGLSFPQGSSFIDQGDGTGLFSWTPMLSQAGQYKITFQANDGAMTTQRHVTINVLLVEDQDKDNDGMDDDWELEHFGSLERDGTADYDNDGKTDLEEFLDETDPAQFNTTGLPVIDTPEVGSEISEQTVSLSITNAIHDVETLISYQFQLYADEDLNLLLEQSPLISETEMQTDWLPAQTLMDNHWYTWRVRVYNGESYSQWVTGYFFVNTTNDEPTIPDILTPPDGTQVSTTTPALEISPAVDIDGDTLKYSFVLYNDESKTVEIDRIDNFSPSDTSLVKWFIMTPLNDGQQYYWAVQVNDGEGGVVETPLVSFLVDTANQSPGSPTLIEPVINAQSAAADVNIILGNSIDPEQDVLSYYFELDDQVDFNSSNKQQMTLASGLTRTTWALYDLNDNRQYYWRARAFDGHSYSDWIQGYFTVNLENDAPEVPVISNPGDQAWVTTLQPILQAAKATDPDGDNVLYDYELYVDAELTNRVNSHQSSSVNWPIEDFLVDNTWYYWRVRSIDEQGAFSAWTPVSHFFVNNNGKDDEPVINLLTPSDNQPVDSSYLIRWSDADPDSNAQINLYFGTSALISESSLIVENLEENAEASGDSYRFDTSELAGGEYYIMATITDKTSTRLNIAPGKLIKQNNTPELVLARDSAYKIDTGRVVGLTAEVTNDSQSLYEYRFLIKGEMTQNQMQVLHDWSLDNFYAWDSSTFLGGLSITVEARRQDMTGQVGSAVRWFNVIDPDNPPATGVSMSLDKTSPQIQGSFITLTAAAEGGSGLYEYRFLVKGDATLGKWQAITNWQWSDNNQIVWDTNNYPGSYEIKVKARNKNAFDTAVTASANIEISAQSALVLLSRDSSSTINKGEQVLLTATAIGLTGMFEYRFQIKGETTAYQYLTLQSWSEINTTEWDSSLYTGGYTLKVEQRISGDSSIQSQDTLWFKVIDPEKLPATGATLSVSPESPQAQSALISLTATGEGGSGIYEYLFQVKGEASLNKWKTLQSWSESAAAEWDSHRYPGANTLRVKVRNLDSTDAAVSAESSYNIMANSPVVVLERDTSSTVNAGQVVSLNAQVFGSGASYEYRYRIKGKSTSWQYELLQDWSADTALQWDSSNSLDGLSIYVEIRASGQTDVLDTNRLWFKVLP